MKKSFSDRLTPGQIQSVFDSLEIDWRPKYNPSNDGWVNCYHDNFNSDLSINIRHGGFVDQYKAGHIDPVEDGIPIRGDIVTLVTLLMFSPNEEIKAIEYIQKVCGLNKSISPPDMPEGGKFASEWLKKENNNHFVRLPISIMQSNLSGNEKIVWSAIFSRCGKDEIYSFPGLSQIGKDTGLSRPTVSKSIHHLIEYGLLIEKFKGHNKAPSRFPIVLPKCEINKRIKEKHNTAGKETLLGVVKKFNNAGKDPLPELETELKTQQLNTQAYKCKTEVYAPVFSFGTDISIPEGYSNLFKITSDTCLKYYKQFILDDYSKGFANASFDDIVKRYGITLDNYLASRKDSPKTHYSNDY